MIVNCVYVSFSQALHYDLDPITCSEAPGQWADHTGCSSQDAGKDADLTTITMSVNT